MAIDERIWRLIRRRLGYSEEQLDEFRKNPRNVDVVSKGSDLMNKHIILKVVESHGCNSGHKVGDEFYFDGAGNLLTKLCPKRVCGYSLSSALLMIYAANEMIYAGVDPNTMRFRRSGCFDVGLECGGWGRIVLELRVEDRE